MLVNQVRLVEPAISVQTICQVRGPCEIDQVQKIHM